MKKKHDKQEYENWQQEAKTESKRYATKIQWKRTIVRKILIDGNDKKLCKYKDENKQ